MITGKIAIHDFGDTSSMLHCPNCGEGFLHQGEVAVYRRPEDGDMTIVTKVLAGGCPWIAAEPSERSLNPSPRRVGIRIEFICENCAANPVLRIAQHKGAELISWEYQE